MATDRLSISHRIYFGFGFLILALLGLGAYATFQFDEMAGSTEIIGEKITLVGGANDYALSLQELSDAILVYAQSTKIKDREKVDQIIEKNKDVEKQFIEVLETKHMSEQGAKLEAFSARYQETLGPLLLRIENIGASADVILMGANKLVASGPELAAKLINIAKNNPEYQVLEDRAHDVIKASNRALLNTLSYAVKPNDNTLSIARDSTSKLDEVLAQTKTDMSGLSRSDRKVLKFLGRDNDLLKQGYVQFQGSNLGLIQSFNEYRTAIEETMAFASSIRQTAIAEQNHTTSLVSEASQSTIVSYVVTMIVVAIIAILLGAFTSRSILGPLRRVTHDMMRLGDGDTEIDLHDRDRRDEVGHMAKAVVVFRQNALDVERLTQQRLEDQKREEEKRSSSLMAMADTIESETGAVLEKVAVQTKELGDTVISMSQSAEHVSTQANEVAKEADSSLALAQSVAEAAQQLSTSIDMVSTNVDRQRAIAQTAISKAQDSSRSVRTLSEAADSIGNVVAMINDIAAQTNMLALNATIEAERAGVAGKGFAVVASEVKQLATQTSKATAEIAQQIESVRSVTQECVGSIEEINRIIDDMARISSDVATSVEDQTLQTRQISRNIQDSFEVSESLSKKVSSASAEMQGVQKLSDDLGKVSRRVGSMVESLQMSLNTAIRSASETMSDETEDKQLLLDHEVEVTLTGPRGTFRSKLLDISNNGMALFPTIDVRMGDEFEARLSDLPGSFKVEILSKRGLQSPKTRIRFTEDMEERSEIVRYVVELWAKRLRDDILGERNVISLSDYRSAAE